MEDVSANVPDSPFFAVVLVEEEYNYYEVVSTFKSPNAIRASDYAVFVVDRLFLTWKEAQEQADELNKVREVIKS